RRSWRARKRRWVWSSVPGFGGSTMSCRSTVSASRCSSCSRAWPKSMASRRRRGPCVRAGSRRSARTSWRSRIEARSRTPAEVDMAELDDATLLELRLLRDRLTRAELAGDSSAKALAQRRLAELLDGHLLGELLATAEARPQHTGPIRFPVPYYGGKFGAAPQIERAMGPIVNLVIPFGGSLGCLLGRSTAARVETANDKVGSMVSGSRAVRYEPFAVAEACALTVHEVTLHAVPGRLLEARESLSERLRADPRAYDVEAASWWIWGRSAWL